MEKGEHKILIICGQELGLSPGQRFRFEQYLEFIKDNRIQYDISPLITQEDIKTLYSKGVFLKKALIFIKSLKKRFKDLKRIKSGEYDAVFMFREALMIRSIYFEKKIKKTGVPIILDFDDSIWLMDVSDANKKMAWLKNPAKTSKIIELSNLVITGNEYLQSYSKKINNNTIIIPTTIDTSLYKKTHAGKTDDDTVIIGWSGSITTLKHFKTALRILIKLKKKYRKKIKIEVIGDGNYANRVLEIKGKWWKAETEVKDLSRFDIGIMPLPDDKWTWGKCGLKGLQYMALEIPTVMSPVGVNTEIIRDGVNGFLATTGEEWVEKLSLLIESPELREKLGKAGRQTVVEKYSLEANKQKWLDAFKSVL